MTEDMRLRHDDPEAWRRAHEGAEDDWRGPVAWREAEGAPEAGWTGGEIGCVVALGLLVGLVVAGWLLEGFGIGLWELWR